ncbi:MAG: TonB-dependent receptor [Caulobacteraceae bacterium]
MCNSGRVDRLFQSSRVMLMGASALSIMAAASAAQAQDASPAAQDPATQATGQPLDRPAPPSQTTRPPGSNGDHQVKKDDGVSEVVVTARRQAIQNAVVRKERADQIQDSIIADEAGKLPDASVTEVLQRLPGVSITHFDAVGDPDHFSAEGSGLVVRGLSQVNSTLNGREVFSANGGRTLLFEDVPPELLAGVDVIKSSTPDLIEGGIGGDVNLRTKQPFDYSKQTFNLEADGTYSDFAKEGRPGGSALYANNWQTPIGKVGLLLDLAYSDLANRADTIQVEPYFPQTVNGQNVYVPGGFDYRSRTFDRKRLGSYESLDWAPNDNLRFFQTFFRSDYKTTSVELGVYNTASNDITVAPGGNATFGANGGLLSSDDLIDTSWNPIAPTTGTNPASTSGDTATTDIGYDKQHSYTQDFSQGFTWNANSALTVTGAFQFVYSQSTTQNIDLYGETTVPSYGINLTGNLPVVTVPGSSTLANPSNYVWDATMDHIEDHIGRLFSWNTDADLRLSNDGFFRNLKFGLRLSEQNESDDVSAYNWTALTPSFEGSGFNYISNAPASDYTIYSFPNFFQGMANLPGSAVFPSLALAKGYPGNLTAIHQMFGLPGDTTQPVTYTPYDEARSRTITEAIYGQIRFGTDALFWPMEGNFGVRVVNDSNKSTGAISEPTGQVIYNGALATLPGGGLDYGGGRTRVEVLPALNFQFLPRPDVHLRFAGSQTMTNPSFSNLAAAGSISFATDTTHNITGTTAYIGNPTLKPQISNNLDFSAEWYPKGGGQLHFSAFYKQIRDYISYGTFSEQLPVAYPGVTQNATVAVTNYFNAQPATIKGIEIGGERFFNFLPKPFDGLGVQANFTYLQSKSPGDQSFDINGNRITGLPVDLLSKYNYNLVGEYERGPISARLAWDWRSKYLLTPTANGTDGTYTSAAGSTIVYDLPVFSGAYGQLDLGASYAFTKNLTLVFDAQNLTDSTTRTYMGYGSQQYGRSWFITDRRYMTAIRLNF